MSGGSAKNGIYFANIGRNPILNPVLICPLNKKNRGGMVVALIQSLQGSQASRRDVAVEEIGVKRTGGIRIAHV